MTSSVDDVFDVVDGQGCATARSTQLAARPQELGAEIFPDVLPPETRTTEAPTQTPARFPALLGGHQERESSPDQEADCDPCGGGPDGPGTVVGHGVNSWATTLGLTRFSSVGHGVTKQESGKDFAD